MTVALTKRERAQRYRLHKKVKAIKPGLLEHIQLKPKEHVIYVDEFTYYEIPHRAIECSKYRAITILANRYGYSIQIKMSL